MLNKNNFYSEQKRSRKEREIQIILNELFGGYIDKNPAFLIDNVRLNLKGDNLKIYLDFLGKNNNKDTIKFINKNYPFLTKRKIAQNKMFSYIPSSIIFLEKEKKDELIDLEKIIKDLNIQ